MACSSSSHSYLFEQPFGISTTTTRFSPMRRSVPSSGAAPGRSSGAMASPPQRRRLAPWSVYLGACSVLLVLYLFVPPLQGSAPVMNALGLSPVVAILAGVRRHRPRFAAPWYWFAGGFALFWGGDVYTYSYWKLFHADVPFPSPGDGLYV